MATIVMSKGVTATATAKTRQDDHVAYKVENVIDFADALVLKGSALAADDIITALVAPPGTAILAAGLQNLTASDSTTLTLHLGITTTVGTATADIDEWVVSFDNEAAAVGDYSPGLDAAPGVVVCSGFTPIDMELATLTGTLTVGKVRVWAILCPIGASNKNVGIALVGS
jgi:hypothetical protein